MKCPNCGNEMIESRAGHLCLSCGHVESGSAPSPASDANIATGKDSHDQMRSAAAAHAAGTEPPANTSSTPDAPTGDSPSNDTPAPPAPDAAPPPPPAAPTTDAAPPASTAAPWEAPASDKPDSTADSAKDGADSAASPTVEVKPATPAEPESTTESTPSTADLSAVEKAVAQVEHAVDASADEPAKADDAKPEDDAADADNSGDESDESDEPKDTPEKKPEEADKPEDDKTEDNDKTDDSNEPQTDDDKTDEVATAAVTPAESSVSEAAPEPSASDAAPEPAPEDTSADDTSQDQSSTDDHDQIDHDLSEPPKPESDPVPEPDPVPESDPPSNETPKPETPKGLGETGAIGMPAATPSGTAPADAPPSLNSVAGGAGAAAAAAAPVGTPSSTAPLQAATHPRPFQLGRFAKIMAIVLGGLLVLGGGSLAAYLYLISPQKALSAYLGRLTAAKTSTLAANISSTSDGYRFTIKLDGKNDFTDVKKPKIDLGVTGEISAAKGTIMPAGDSGGGSVSGHIVVTDQTLYFQILKFSFLSELLPIKVSEDWYKYNLGESDTGKCISQGKDSGSFLGSNMLTQIPVKDAKFAGIETVNGTQMLRYQGLVNNAKIKDAIDKANQELSADCKLDISADDFKDVSITYNLWRGWSKDRILISVNSGSGDKKANTEIVIDSGAYNQAVDIKAPSNAKDVEQLLSDLTGQTQGAFTSIFGDATGPEPEFSPAPTPSPTAGDAATRDAQRRTDLGTYLAAMKAKAKNGYYPVAAPPAVSVNATDPTTTQPYVVAKAPATALGHIEYRPGGNCTAQPNTPGKTGTRYFALYTLLESGQAACLDNR